MQSLALHYLSVDKDATEARKWFKRSIQNGNFKAKLLEAEFEADCKTVEAEQSELVKVRNQPGILLFTTNHIIVSL